MTKKQQSERTTCHHLNSWFVAMMVMISMLTGVVGATISVKADTNKHATTNKKQHSADSKTFWQGKSYVGSFKRPSTLGKKQQLTNKLSVSFTKDNQYIQQVTTSLSMAGVQEQVTNGTVARKGNRLEMTPKSTATAVYKTQADYKNHKASNFHRSGDAFKSQLIFSADDQPMAYQIKSKQKQLTGIRTKASIKMTQKQLSLTNAQDYIKPIENH